MRPPFLRRARQARQVTHGRWQFPAMHLRGALGRVPGRMSTAVRGPRREQTMQVRDLMTTNPYGVQAQEPVRRAAELMRRHGVGSIVVYDQHSPIGMLTDRDVVTECVAGGHEGANCASREHMTADPVTIAQDASAEEALGRMADEQVRRLLVTDEGTVVGIIALGDLAAAMPSEAAVANALREISIPVRASMHA